MEPEQIKILIAEGDPIQALGLSVCLQHEGYCIAGMAGDAAQAERLFKEHEVDIVLMDIHLPGKKDGIDTVLALMQIKRIPVIYLTAAVNGEMMDRIKQIHPATALKKPYQSSQVCMSIDLALHNFMAGDPGYTTVNAHLNTRGTAKSKAKDATDAEMILRQRNHIFVKRNFQFVKINFIDILYLEADNNYVHIITKDKKFTVRLSLIQVMQKINYNKLVRINRSSAINIEAIQSFNETQVFIAQHEISIGKNFKQAFFTHLGLR
jgi:two-component system, response regulator PdtaR